MGGMFLDATGGMFIDATGGMFLDASGGSSGGGTFAMRADKPFADFNLQQQFDFNRKFPPRYWNPDLYSLRVLVDFLKLNWEQRINIGPPPATNSQITKDEIAALLILAVTERPEALGEIIQQDSNCQLYWLQLLMINPHSHPATYLMMKMASRVAEVVMVHYKSKPNFLRPRPSQICPTLLPPIAVPGHAAYPSGHAMLSYLMSECLAELMPGAGAKGTRDAMFELSRRVALNREIAGLHYASDSAAGKSIASQLLPILHDCASYQSVFNDALQEWA